MRPNFAKGRFLSDKVFAYPCDNRYTLRTTKEPLRVLSHGQGYETQRGDTVSEPQYTQLTLDFEIWKTIPGYDGRYEASSHGRICNAMAGRRGQAAGIREPYAPDKIGYVRIGIIRDGKLYRPGVHQLVALAFLGPCVEGYEVNHIDLNKLNNRADNLEYITHKANIRHARENRETWARPARKLTEQDVADIRASTLTHRQIAEWKGISQPLVTNIRNRKVWK